MSASRWRRAIPNAALALGSLVCLVLLAEFALAVLVPLLYRPRFTKIDPYVGWYHSHGVSEVDELEGHRFSISYNSHGYRSPEHAYDRVPRRKRIVVLGDSFTDGSEVGDQELFTWKLEQTLGDVEVVNLGVYGYQTAQEYVTLERVGLQYAPDAVVLMTVPNDFPGNVVAFESFGPAPRFVLSGEGLAFEDLSHPNAREAMRASHLPAPQFVSSHSTLYYFLNTYIYQPLTANRIQAFREARLAGMPFDRQAELYRRIVVKMHELCASKGIPLLVVFVHQRADVERREASAFADLGARLRESGVHVFDLFDQLKRQEATGPTPFYVTDPHWNTVGHSKVAEWLAGPVREVLESH